MSLLAGKGDRRNHVALLLHFIELLQAALWRSGAATSGTVADVDIVHGVGERHGDRQIEQSGQHQWRQVAAQHGGILTDAEQLTLTGHQTQHLRQVLAEGRSLIMFDRAVQGMEVETIQANFVSVAKQATELLLTAGHQRIAYISSMHSDEPYSSVISLGPTPVAQRVSGMIDAYRAAGKELDPVMIQLNALNEASIEQILTGLLALPEPPSALIASDNLIAVGILRALAKRGLRVPDDISFVMYDDFPWTELMSPPLTVVAQPVYEMGREAARRLICHIRQQSAGRLPEFNSWVVVRNSVRENPHVT